MFVLHQSSQGVCIPRDFNGNKLQGDELRPNILANVVVFWKCDCSFRFVLAIILACELSFLFAWCQCQLYIFLSPNCLLARTFPNVLMPENLLLWCGQQTEPKLNLLVLLVLAAACQSPFTPPAWVPVPLSCHSQTRRPCLPVCLHNLLPTVSLSPLGYY